MRGRRAARDVGGDRATPMQVLLTMPITDGSTTDRLRELCVAGEAAYDAADLVDATGCWVEALVLCEMLIAQGHADVALVRAHLQLNLGVAWHEAFEYDAAQTQLEAAYNGYDALAPDLIPLEERDGLKADVLVNVANVWNAIGHPADSAALYEEAIEVYARLVTSGHGAYALHEALARSNLANVLSDQASFVQAESQYMTARRILEPLAEAGDRDALARLGILQSNVSALMFRRGRGSFGIELLRSAHDLLSRAAKTAGAESCPRVEVARASNVIKLALRDASFPDASQACLDALDVLSHLIDTGRVQFSHELALCHVCVGLCDIGQQNKLDHLETAIDLLLTFLNAGNAQLVGDVAVLYLNLGSTLGSGGAIRSKVGAFARARLLFEALHESNPALYDHRLGNALQGLGAAHGERGRALRCAALQEQSVRHLRAARAGFSDSHVVDRFLCSSLTNLGTAQRCLGDLAASLATFHDIRRELGAAKARGTDWRSLIHGAYFQFGDTFSQLGLHAEAQALREQGLDHLTRQPHSFVGGAATAVPPLASAALLGAWRQALSWTTDEGDDAQSMYRSASRAHDALCLLYTSPSPRD